MAQNAVVAGEGRLTDWVSIGVLASSVPRDVDELTAATASLRCIQFWAVWVRVLVIKT